MTDFHILFFKVIVKILAPNYTEIIAGGSYETYRISYKRYRSKRCGYKFHDLTVAGTRKDLPPAKCPLTGSRAFMALRNKEL
jgi:hypothetical protein